MEIRLGSFLPVRKPASFRAFETICPEELEAELVSSFGCRAFDLPAGGEGFRARFSGVKLQHVGLSRSDRSAAEITFSEVPFFKQQVCLGGVSRVSAGGKVVSLKPHDSCAVSANVEMTSAASSDVDLLALRIDADELSRKLGALLGFQPKRPLRFETAEDDHRRESQSFGRLIVFAADELSRTGAILPRPVLDELEQSLVVGFLSCNRNNFTELLIDPVRQVAPWQVRLVEDYVEANWNLALTLEALSEATGASTRAIFNSFKKSRGYSPMAFLKQVRLRHANEMLSMADGGASVTAVAFACCFQNVGHFARDYRAAFGELPSETLARTRFGRAMPVSGVVPAGGLIRRPSARGGRSPSS
jgi:AraC-like DNA-binding protein